MGRFFSFLLFVEELWEFGGVGKHDYTQSCVCMCICVYPCIVVPASINECVVLCLILHVYLHS